MDDKSKLENLDKQGEAGLIWDEYKYRHDLIWRHLIRSTLAVVALITVQFLEQYRGNNLVVMVAFVLAVGYTLFTYFVLKRELELYEQVKQLHRLRQHDLFDIHDKGKIGQPSDFTNRVKLYIGALLTLSVLATLAYFIQQLWKVLLGVVLWN